MTRTQHPLTLLVLAATATMLPLVAAYGWGTTLWQLDTAEQFEEGELDQVVVSSLGEIKIGSRLTRIDLQDVAVVWAIHQTVDGTVYLGTGNNGQLSRLEGTRVEKVASLDGLVVTALASDSKGVLYAGTLPGGKIYRVEPSTKGPATSKLLVELEKADHIWDLEYDTKRQVLFAATGPEGKLFAISPSGRADLYYDSPEKHLLSLFLEAPGGDLLIGTSPKALLLRATGPGRVLALHDFDGTEVKGIASRAAGDLYLAVNTFPEDTSASKSPSSTKAKAPPTRPKPGKGKIFRRLPDGSIERLLEYNEGHLTSIEAPEGDLVYAGTGAKGRVVAVDNERVSYTVMDVEERQVLALALSGKQRIIATGDAGAVYRVEAAVPGLAEYRSAPLDAGFVSRWGRLEWRGQGQLEVQTRSGNTKGANETWSDWSPPLASSGAPIKSPAARYLQVRVRWNRDASALLRALGVFHLPNNQRAVITEISADVPFEQDRPLTKGKSGGSLKAGPSSKNNDRATKVELSWKVDNPDDDRLRYRLYFREESESVWRQILPSDRVLTGTSYDWETDPVPSGHYLIKVEASDELRNPADLTLRHEKISPPVVIDNQPPRLEGLKAKGRQVSGRALDDFSPIAALEYSLDGRSWLPVFPRDQLFDERDERFDFELSPEVTSGPYVIAIRAHDRAKNATTARLTTTIP